MAVATSSFGSCFDSSADNATTRPLNILTLRAFGPAVDWCLRFRLFLRPLLLLGGGLDAPSGGEDRVVAGSSPDDSRSLPTTLMPLSAMIIQPAFALLVVSVPMGKMVTASLRLVDGYFSTDWREADGAGRTIHPKMRGDFVESEGGVRGIVFPSSLRCV